MTKTDQAFIRAYRRDAARASTPAPTAARTPTAARATRQPAALPVAFQTSVEFVGAEYPTNPAALRSIPIDEAALTDDAIAIVGALPPLAPPKTTPSKLAPTKKKNPPNASREGSIGRGPSRPSSIERRRPHNRQSIGRRSYARGTFPHRLRVRSADEHRRIPLAKRLPRRMATIGGRVPTRGRPRTQAKCLGPAARRHRRTSTGRRLHDDSALSGSRRGWP